MPKIEIEVCQVGSTSTWKEKYDFHEGDPQAWAQAMLDRFNSTLRPGENPRELVSVEVLPEESQEHIWRKENVYTIVRGSQVYDKMRCERCGVTGKRHGLVSGVKRDSEYRAKKYEKCTGHV
ncbi:hypothetical protein YDYSY3_57600 [Paenibacillus chitinolyticus]|uniref:hypothetical protein n=1 Tax=Paenibacillus chitinolyticus TaxID=79263 RepID=UPI0026E4B006|nr:hypothetical protein [Paenibacillus chitinolyticus]GKS14760.1 hypothetical protein YDYSY3_57600 [Paenibacillus chitinolyticus]